MNEQDLAAFCAGLEQSGHNITHVRLDHIITPHKVEILTDDGAWHEYTFPTSMTNTERLKAYDRLKEQRGSLICGQRPPRS